MIHERAEPRKLTRHGVWELPGLRVKVYGIAVQGRAVTEDSLAAARRFVAAVQPAEAAAAERTLGFVIIHPGAEGETIAAHWWEQGCVLCHRVARRLYASGDRAEVAARGVIGCVWEMAVIAAEQEIWRATMMADRPAPELYMARVLEADTV